MKIILPRCIYKYIYKSDIQTKWMIFEINRNLKITTYMIGDSFNDLLKELKRGVNNG